MLVPCCIPAIPPPGLPYPEPSPRRFLPALSLGGRWLPAIRAAYEPILPRRSRLLQGPMYAQGGLPILGPASPFQYGSAVIDPGSLFFRAGNPIGGPLESFRGVTASEFPFYASIFGPGAPLSPEWLGIAGAPI